MTTVNIQPLPLWARGKKYKPGRPPIFPDGPPTDDDYELALALIDALDPESQEWYASFVQSCHSRIQERRDCGADD